MDAERQQGRAYQRTFDFEGREEAPRHGQGGDDGIRPARPEEPQPSTASGPARALTERLMEEVCRPENLNRAYRRVKANKGAPGVDGMTISQLRSWIATHKEELIASLLAGSYRPQAVRGVEIPKPDGGVRQLGIPMLHSYYTSLQRVLGLSQEGPALPWACLDHEAERRVQERRAGLRKRAMISGVKRIHQGPCDVDWMPSRTPDWHQSAIVETVTLSNSAATLAVQRPSAR